MWSMTRNSLCPLAGVSFNPSLANELIIEANRAGLSVGLGPGAAGVNVLSSAGPVRSMSKWKSNIPSIPVLSTTSRSAQPESSLQRFAIVVPLKSSPFGDGKGTPHCLAEVGSG